jgi:hypothetical protein
MVVVLLAAVVCTLDWLPQNANALSESLQRGTLVLPEPGTPGATASRPVLRVETRRPRNDLLGK